MFNKSQMSLFVVMALILVIAMVFILIVVKDTDDVVDSQISKNSDLPFLNAKSYVESCVEKTGEDAIEFISFNGGYYTLKSQLEYVDYSVLKVPVYYNKEYMNLLPSKDNILKEIEDYYSEKLESCIDDINISQDISIDMKSYNVNINIIEENQDLVIDLESPIKIVYQDKISTYDDITIFIDTNLFTVHDLINSFLKKQDENRDFVLNSYLVELADDNNIDVEMMERDDSVVYSFIFDESGNNIIYNFAIEYDWGEYQ